MNLPFFIARRYLFAPKSHNVINIISAISAIGMAIGTAALVIILSVYNGFDKLIEDSLSQSAPDILITPRAGKYFTPDERFGSFGILSGVDVTSRGILEENIFLSYDGQQGLAKVRGVEDDALFRGEIPLCEVGSSTAMELGINPRFIAPLELYYPSKEREVSVMNPYASLNGAKVHPERLFNTNNSVEEATVIVPVSIMRDLLELHSEEVSAVEVRVNDYGNAKKVKSAYQCIKETLGADFHVRDRYEQNEALFKMMKYEKASIFLILIFIVIIITFNIFGSLTMLIIEKEGDIGTFKSMGATPKTLRKIFTTEGWLISLSGLAAGLITGVALTLVQQHFGIIKMPGSYIVDAYPVIIKWTDIAIIAISVAFIGYLIALIPSRKRIPLEI